MNDVGKYTIKRPDIRFREIEGFNHEISGEKNQVFNVNSKNNSVIGYQMQLPEFRTD